MWKYFVVPTRVYLHHWQIFYKYFYFELTSMNFKVHHVVRKPNTVFMFYMNSVLQTYNSIKDKLQKCLYAVNYNS